MHADPPRPESAATARRTSSRPVVLIVVASLQLRSAIRQCLQSVQPDCQYLEAASGEEALGILEAHPADLMLLDLRLPGMRAQETTRQAKLVAPHCQVVLLAEPYEAAWLSFDPQHGASGSICKDFLYEELDLLVPMYLGTGSTERDAADGPGRGGLPAG